jgi:enoyl-CoA hydratase/carnithine racemase
MQHTITLPESLTLSALAQLASALETAPREAGVWVFEGSARAFCTGMDLEAATRPDGDVHAALGAYARCLDALRLAPRPTIALVDGNASGGGVGLAAACDLVLATPRATFALPESLFGLLPSLVLPVVAERITLQRARLVTLSAASFDAESAAQMGLADAVVPRASARAELATRSRALSRIDSRRVEQLRRWMLDFPKLSWAAQLAHGAALTAELVCDPRTRANIRRFLDDGTPPWVRP